MHPGTRGLVLFAQAQRILDSNQNPVNIVQLVRKEALVPSRKFAWFDSLVAKKVRDRIKPWRQSKRIKAIFWSACCISGRCESLEVIKQHKSPGFLGFSNYSKHIFMTILSGQMNWIRGRYLVISKTFFFFLLFFCLLIVLHVISVTLLSICWPATSQLSCHVSI